jgi:hypothetical protein
MREILEGDQPTVGDLAAGALEHRHQRHGQHPGHRAAEGRGQPRRAAGVGQLGDRDHAIGQVVEAEVGEGGADHRHRAGRQGDRPARPGPLGDDDRGGHRLHHQHRRDADVERHQEPQRHRRQHAGRQADGAVEDQGRDQGAERHRHREHRQRVRQEQALGHDRAQGDGAEEHELHPEQAAAVGAAELVGHAEREHEQDRGVRHHPGAGRRLSRPHRRHELGLARGRDLAASDHHRAAAPRDLVIVPALEGRDPDREIGGLTRDHRRRGQPGVDQGDRRDRQREAQREQHRHHRRHPGAAPDDLGHPGALHGRDHRPISNSARVRGPSMVGKRIDRMTPARQP